MKKEFQYGDAPAQKEYIEKMKELATLLDMTFNGEVKKPQDRQTGFILMVFPIGSHKGRCNYISNGIHRDDVVVLLKEQAARFESTMQEGNKTKN